MWQAITGKKWALTNPHARTAPRVPTGAQLSTLKKKTLSAMLGEQTAFTEQEWAAFNIDDLKKDDFAKSGTLYYKPSPLADTKEQLSKAELQQYEEGSQCDETKCTSPDGTRL